MCQRALMLVVAMTFGGCTRTIVYDPMSTIPVAQPSGIAPGTHVAVTLQTPVMSGGGAMASFVVSQNVADAYGTIVLPIGTPVMVRITDRPARGMGRPGRLRFELLGAFSPTGIWVPMSGESEVRGIPRRGRAWGLTIGMSFLYFPFSLLHLRVRGREAFTGFGMTIDATVL